MGHYVIHGMVSGQGIIICPSYLQQRVVTGLIYCTPVKSCSECEVNYFIVDFHVSLNHSISEFIFPTSLLCGKKNLLGFYEWGPEVQRCYFQKSLLVFRCQFAHAYGMFGFFFSEVWARWQSVCSQQILTADVHAQKLWRNPKVWMVACLVNGRQGDHVRNVPFACISHELGGWRQEQLDGLCLMQATFLKNFKFLKNLEVCVLALPVR